MIKYIHLYFIWHLVAYSYIYDFLFEITWLMCLCFWTHSTFTHLNILYICKESRYIIFVFVFVFVLVFVFVFVFVMTVTWRAAQWVDLGSFWSGCWTRGSQGTWSSQQEPSSLPPANNYEDSYLWKMSRFSFYEFGSWRQMPSDLNWPQLLPHCVPAAMCKIWSNVIGQMSVEYQYLLETIDAVPVNAATFAPELVFGTRLIPMYWGVTIKFRLSFLRSHVES